MFCQKCGQELPENVSQCLNCHEMAMAASPTPPPTTPPPNYLAWAIISTILCCWPLGIPAIVFAAQVNSKFAMGDIQGAEQASKKAKMWSLIAFACGLIGILIYVLFVVLSIVFQS